VPSAKNDGKHIWNKVRVREGNVKIKIKQKIYKQIRRPNNQDSVRDGYMFQPLHGHLQAI
jgi:hypothetical protein